MFKKLYIYTIFLTLFLTGCAMDDWYETVEVPDRDYMEIDFAVPEPTVVQTRAGELSEDDVYNAVVFFFKNGGTGDGSLEASTVLQAQPFSFTGTPSEEKIQYNDALKDYLAAGNSVRVVAVANAGWSQSEINTITNLKVLQGMSENIAPDARTTMTMSGFAQGTNGDKELLTRSDLNKKVTINLYRNAAKAVVTLDDNDKTKDFTLSGFALWSRGANGYYAAAAYGLKDGIGADDSPEHGNFTTEAAYGYAQQGYPNDQDARDNLGKDKRAYVIVKGKYKGEECFYRIDLMRKVKEEGTNKEKTEYLFLTPNTEYDIKIVKVRCKGYASEHEASLHPMSDFMEVEIHDHLSTVLSMTSDGLHELGVTKDVLHRNNETDSGLSFTLKLYSKVDAEEEDLNLTEDADGNYVDEAKGFSMKVTQGKEWLGFASNTNAGSDNSGEAHTGAGTVYTIGLKYKDTKFTGELEGTIQINWQGLTREVDVVWEKTFNPSEICYVSLKISTTATDAAGTATTISDYWKFLAGTDTSHKLFGVTKAQNNGNVRNQGFHLPLYYGGTKDAAKWTYTYTITPKSGTIEGAYDYYQSASNNARAATGIDQFANLNTKITKDGNSIKLEVQATEYAWNYMVGKLMIKIDGVEYPFDLYHTGFFHKETTGNAFSHVKGTAPEAGYYYYEVRTVNYKNNMYHWLDRNIGAKAGSMAVRDASGSDLIGNSQDESFNSDAVGAYITPAEYKAYANVEEKIYDNLCPPGFRIPTSNEWDLMRNSGSFITTETTAAGVPYYQACLYDNRGNQVFFPKVLYRTNEGLVGDSRAGYYWTKTAASGIEKAQIGRWMKAMYMSGSSNAIINGAVDDYGMQIRAISGYKDDEAPAETTIGFKVTGATHVYIYDAGKPWPNGESVKSQTYFDTNKYGLMTWPGQSIGEAATMLNSTTHAGEEYTFTYTTSTPKENLRVVFAYVDGGKIRVFDRVTESNKTGTDQYNGFPIVDSYVFKFTNTALTTYSSDIAGYTSTEIEYQYVIRWPQIGADNNDYYRILVEYQDGSNNVPGFHGASEQFNKEFANPKSFGWVFSSAPDENKKMIIHVYKHNDSAEKTYKYAVTRDSFTKEEVINNKNSKVLDLGDKEADFIDGHSIGGGGDDPVYSYQIQWSQIGTTNDDYCNIYLEYSNGSKVPDFSSGSPKNRSEEHGTNPNKTFYYNFTTAPTSTAMKVYIYKSNNTDRMVYDGTITSANFNVTEGTTKICKLDKNKFKTEDTPTQKNYRIYFPDDSNKFWMWYQENGTNTNIFNGSDDLSGWSKDGSYYYKDFSLTGHETSTIGYTRKAGTDKYPGKTLSDFTYDSSLNKYVAHITTGDVLQGGKPVQETYKYRVINSNDGNKLFGDRSYMEMTQSGSTWNLTLTRPKGNFKIEKRRASDNALIETIGSDKSNTTVNLNDSQDHPTKKDGSEFWIDQSGNGSNVTLKYNPSTNRIYLN